MRQNWHEFGDYSLYADAWGCEVGVNTVMHPPEFSVYTLPLEELRKILKGMEAQASRLDSLLKRNRAIWFAEFDRVRLMCQQPESNSDGLLRQIQPLKPSAAELPSGQKSG
jgi:hypothetical protein